MSPGAGEGATRVAVAPPEAGQTLAVEACGTSVLVCNVGGELFAVENQCSHARVSLSEGRLIEGEVECPVHGARFDVKTGTAMCRPARRAIRTFRVERVEDGMSLQPVDR